jgi:hypothetical protein
MSNHLSRLSRLLFLVLPAALVFSCAAAAQESASLAVSESLHYRGFRSEGDLAVSGLK